MQDLNCLLFTLLVEAEDAQKQRKFAVLFKIQNKNGLQIF